MKNILTSLTLAAAVLSATLFFAASCGKDKHLGEQPTEQPTPQPEPEPQPGDSAVVVLPGDTVIRFRSVVENWQITGFDAAQDAAERINDTVKLMFQWNQRFADSTADACIQKAVQKQDEKTAQSAYNKVYDKLIREAAASGIYTATIFAEIVLYDSINTKIAADTLELELDETPPPANNITVGFKVKLTNLVINGVAENGDAVEYLKSFERTFSTRSTDSTVPEPEMRAEALTLAKAEFAEIVAGFNQGQLDAKTLSSIQKPEALEMSVANLQFCASVSANIALYYEEGETQTDETPVSVASEPQCVANDKFVLTVDFGGRTVTCVDFADSVYWNIRKGRDFREANGIPLDNLTVHLKNANVLEGNEDEKIDLLTQVNGDGNFARRKFSNIVVDFPMPITDYGDIAPSMEIGLKPTEWVINDQTMIPPIFLFNAYKLDENVRINIKNPNSTWYFAGFEAVTPELISILDRICVQPFGLKVDESSPEMEARGDFTQSFTSGTFQSVILYFELPDSYFPTNFVNRGGVVFTAPEPTLQFAILGWKAAQKAIGLEPVE